MLYPYLTAWPRDRWHLPNTKPTDCNNSLSPTAPQSQRCRQPNQTPGSAVFIHITAPILTPGFVPDCRRDVSQHPTYTDDHIKCAVKIHSRQCNQCNHSANKEIYYLRAVLSKWEFCYWGLKYYSLESYFILLMIFSYSRRYCTYQITLRSKDPKPQDEVHCNLNKFFLFTKCNFGQMHTCDLIKTWI